MPNGRLIVKFVILVVCAVCAGVAIERIVRITRWTESSAPLVSDWTHNTSIQLSIEDVDPILSDDYLKCILRPSEPFCLLSEDERLDMIRSDSPKESLDAEMIKNRITNVTADHQTVRRKVRLIADVMDLMKSFGVKAFIIQPSVLFCLLPSFKKQSLLLSGFNPGRVQGSRNLINFGVFEEDGEVLGKMNISNVMLSSRFYSVSISTIDTIPVVFNFSRFAIAAQVFTFRKRNSYLIAEKADEDYWPYGSHENFRIRSIRGPQTANVSIDQLFIPSDIMNFLKETESNKFVECLSSTNHTQEHPFLTPEQLTARIITALVEIKNILATRFVNFWLWSRSFLGFYEHCNVLYYTSGLELSVHRKSVESHNLTAVFSESNFLKIQSNMTSDSGTEFYLDGHGLQVRITILDEDLSHGSWEIVDGRTQTRLLCPPAPLLCSTDVFGQKVNIPCFDRFVGLDGTRPCNYTTYTPLSTR